LPPEIGIRCGAKEAVPRIGPDPMGVAPPGTGADTSAKRAKLKDNAWKGQVPPDLETAEQESLQG